jgi:peptidoglycan hydrolase CwlO-like protein
MDPGYLKTAVGNVLVQGMKATTIAQPADPITYLATWLLHYRDLEDQWKTFKVEQNQLSTDRALYMEELEAEMIRIEEERQRRAEEEARLAEEAARLEAEKNKKKSPEEEEEEKHEPPQEAGDASTVYSELSETF